MTYALATTLTNEDKGYQFADFTEPLEEGWTLTDDGKPDFGHIYRLVQREYGRCQSSVYVDDTDGQVRRVGWFFVSRQRYEDTGEPYLREAWVTVVDVIPGRHELITID